VRCPACRHPDTSVVDSRAAPVGDAIRRRRACDGCGHRFTTYERAEILLPMVVKKDGQRQPFSRDKVLGGIFKAVHRRPVAAAQVYAFGRALEQTLAEAPEREVASRAIGERVLEFLRDSDLIAYVRFATVYKDFADIDGLLADVQALAADHRSRADTGAAAARDGGGGG